MPTTKFDEKFLMLEFSNSKFPNIDNLYNGYFINQHYKKFDNLGLITIGNYIADSNCAYSIIETEKGYLLHLYFLPTNTYEHKRLLDVFRRSTEFEKDNILLEKNDILNVFKYFIIELQLQHHAPLDASLKTSLLYPPMFFIDRDVIFIQLFFYKNKFSKKEMAYWSNVCLKIFVLFQKTLMDESKRFIKTSTKPNIDTFKHKMTRTIINFYKYNSLYFVISACMDFHQNRREINKEINKIIFQFSK